MCQLAFSADLSAGLLQLLQVIAPFGLLVYFARTIQDERLWYWLGIVLGTMGAAGGGVVLATDTLILRAHHNQYVLFPASCIFAVCLAFRYASSQRRGQLLLFFLATVNFFWVAIVGSRGGLLIASCGLAYLLLNIRGTSRRILVFGLGGLLTTAVFALFPGLLSHAVEGMSLLLKSDYSMSLRTSGRWELVLGSWYIFLDHPFGVGTGGFEHAWRGLDVGGQLSRI